MATLLMPCLRRCFPLLELDILRHGGGQAPCALGYAAPVPGRWRDDYVNDQFLIIPTRGYAFPPPCPLKINFFLIQFQIPLFEGKWCQMGAQGGSQNPQKSVKIWKSAPQSALWDGT